MQNKNIEEAVNCFKSGEFIIAQKKVNELIKEFPNNHSLYNLLGSILFSQKNFDEAVINYKKSIKINPNYAQGHNNLALTLAALKKITESIHNYQQAIKIKPDYVEAYNNLALLFNRIGKFDESINNYYQAIKIKPDYIEAHKSLGKLLRKIGKVEEARKCFKKVTDLEPNNIEYKISKELLIAPIVKSTKEINFYRSQYEKGLQSLKNSKYVTDYPGSTIKINSFYLSYHNKDNLELMIKSADLFKQMIPTINYVSKNLNKKNGKKIRIGFISEFLTNHTIGKLFGGVIKNINKKKFEVIIFHTKQTKKSEMKDEIDDSANKIVILNINIREQQQQIENENLDIIFYPDISMSPATYFLPYSRLAAVQIASFGHPETTGIDTIDYFLSSTLFEQNSTKKKYSERLICLSEFPIYYEPPKNLGLMKNRKDLKLPKNARLYGCLQTLFKLHPDFDAILAEILTRDPEGCVVLIGGKGKVKHWSEDLKNRWSKNFPIINERSFFTKNLSLLDFISLCNCVDVLLDPLYFGGGNSVLEALTVGTPTITMPDSYLRSNVAAAAYKQMKILKPPIAQNNNEYINLAIELAQNRKKNLSLRKNLKISAKKYLYKNLKVVNKFENFLEKAYQESLKGNKLKDGCIF